MLTEDERNEFKAAADRCVAAAEAAAASDDEPFADETTDAFCELVAELQQKYEVLGFRYAGKTFFLEFEEDEESTYISGVRWIDDDKLEVIE